MLDKYCSAFIDKSDENFKLYEFLNKNNCFLGWQVVAIFYSALCYVKAYLYKKGFPINSINSHDNIRFYLGSESYAKSVNVLNYYQVLYRNSRDARYTTKKISKDRLEYVLKNYMQVKELLSKNYI